MATIANDVNPGVLRGRRDDQPIPRIPEAADGTGSSFEPTLLAQLRDLTGEAIENPLDAMPIGIPLLLHQALILVLGCFPTEPFVGAGRTDLKRSDVIPSYERR